MTLQPRLLEQSYILKH